MTWLEPRLRLETLLVYEDRRKAVKMVLTASVASSDGPKK